MAIMEPVKLLYLPKNQKKMDWYSKEHYQPVTRFLEKKSEFILSALLIYGEKNSDLSGFLEELINKIPPHTVLFYRIDFNFDRYYLDNLAYHILNGLSGTNHPLYLEFLNNFSTNLQKNIYKKMSIWEERYSDWYRILFLQLVVYTSQNHMPVLIFENIHCLKSVELSAISALFRPLLNKDIRIICTSESENNSRHFFENTEIFRIQNLSLPQLESKVSFLYQTSAFNGRLVTNHCYMKTAGNLVKIKFLLESVYKGLLNQAKEDYLDIRHLRQIQIPTRLEKIFTLLFESQPENGRRFLVVLAYLSQPIHEQDFRKILSYFKIQKSTVREWLRGGIIAEKKSIGRRYYLIGNTQWGKWLQSSIPVSQLKDDFFYLYLLHKKNKLKQFLYISPFLYETGEVNGAVELAKLESRELKKIGSLQHALDKLNFLVRIRFLEKKKIEGFESILEEIATLYSHLGIYENAFEILHNQQELISQLTTPEKVKKWLRSSLQIASTLVRMDAYQEARYFIRELKVKDFCSEECQGKCLELLGDVENDLSHWKKAAQNYLLAFNLYQRTGSLENIFSVYSKLKLIYRDNLSQFDKLNHRTIKIFDNSPKKDPNYGLLLRDNIQLKLHKQNYLEAVKVAFNLRKFLRNIYEPNLSIQLGFYYSEIYVLLGKPQLAISHLGFLLNSFYITHSPYYRVQILIQLGLVHKEQFELGKALFYFNRASELCSQFRLKIEYHEIKLQIGHLYTLIYNLLHAGRFLKEADIWATTHQQSSVLLLSKLYLSYYELMRNHGEKSREWLRQAKKLVNLSNNVLDSLNYYYYLSYWLLKKNENQKASIVVLLLLRKSKNLPRYQAAAYYLLAKSYLGQKKIKKAMDNLSQCLSISEKFKLPQVQYLALCEYTRISKKSRDQAIFFDCLKKASEFIFCLAEKIEDNILKTHFLEANAHDDILEWRTRFLG
jgi:hypothetical protein